MALQSKMTVYAAVAGVFALMGGIVYYASLDNVDLEQVEIKLTNVKLMDINIIDDQAKFEVTFLVKNPSEKTLTVAIIDYQLYGDGVLLGSGQYSTADIALPGRALFYSGAEIPLKNIFVLSKSEVNSEIYEKAINEKIINFTSEGNITTQTSWSEIDKDFTTGY
jgi:LEA14-like dessication related protein